MSAQAFYATIIEYFYYPCPARPRILALTASPIEGMDTKTEPSESAVRQQLEEMEETLDCLVWSAEVAGGATAGMVCPSFVPYDRREWEEVSPVQIRERAAQLGHIPFETAALHYRLD